LEGKVRNLSDRSTKAVRQARALPDDAPGRAETVHRAHELDKQIGQPQRDVSGASSTADLADDLADLHDVDRPGADQTEVDRHR
jgi:hypothetical protein